MYIYIYIHVHIHIYIYREMGRETEGDPIGSVSQENIPTHHV